MVHLKEGYTASHRIKYEKEHNLGQNELEEHSMLAKLYSILF